MNFDVSGTASSLILGILLSTAYGAAFHFIVGGPFRRMLFYVFAAWIGFALGHVIGNVLNIDLFKLGALNLLSASLGAWAALIMAWWLVSPNPN